jgi:uncharacterized delta-60 repeat protein
MGRYFFVVPAFVLGLVLFLVYLQVDVAATTASPITSAQLQRDPGDLDPSFGSSGKVTTSFPYSTTSEALAIVLQPDGKSVVAGYMLNVPNKDFALTRYNSDGSLDTSFGTEGRVVTDFAGNNDIAYALALQADGKIVAAGMVDEGGRKFGLARYNSDGTLDSSFGTGGKVTTYGVSEAYAVAIASDGKIVAAGVHSEDFALTRYNSDGSLDKSFGQFGIVITQFGSDSSQVHALALQQDGKIVAAGFKSVSGGGDNFALARYNSNGSLDTSFGSSGRVITDIAGGHDQAAALALYPGGKLVAAGFTATADYNFGIVRYNSNGSLDTSFGTGGKVATDFGGNEDKAGGVAVNVDGTIVAAGYTGSDCGSSEPCREMNFALARYTTDGSLDTGFGTGGRAIADFGPGRDRAFGIGMQPDGKLVAAGSYQPACGLCVSTPDIAVARLNADGTLDSGFGTGGKTITVFTTSNARAMLTAVLSDGKILAGGFAANTRLGSGGSVAWSRYNPDGSLDTTFGDGGRLLTPDLVNMRAVTVQPDGKIVVTGGYSDLQVARFNPDGSLDASFGNGGIVTTHVGYLDEGRDVDIQSDGKIVVAGATGTGPDTRGDFLLVRYNPNGSLDAGFGSNGIVLTHFLGNSEAASGLLILPNGKLVAGGYATASPGIQQFFALARYNTDGSLDANFGTGGKVTTAVYEDGSSTGYALVLQPDGKLVLAGEARSFGDYLIALARYNSDGSLDPDFGTGGKVITSAGPGSDRVNSLVLQSDGRLLAGGTQIVSFPEDTKFLLVRYDPNGSLDASFGTNGVVITEFPGGNAGADAIAQQADGKVVATGYANSSSRVEFALARYQNGGPALTPTPTPTGAPLTSTPAASQTPVPTAISTGTLTPSVIPAGTGTASPPVGTQTRTPTRTATSPTATSGIPTTTATTTANPSSSSTAISTSTSTVVSPSATRTAQQPSPSATRTATRTAQPTATACLLQFADVPLTNTFYPFVRCLACQGIDQGFPCGGPNEPCGPNNSRYFRVNTLIARDDLAHMVAASAGFNEDPGPRKFQDVPPGNPYYVWVQRMANRGLIGGYQCGTQPSEPCVAPGNLAYYRPTANATRGQIAKIVSNGAGYNNTPAGQTFEDVPPSHAFYVWVQRLTSQPVPAMGGYPCGAVGEPCVAPNNRPYFRWGNNATRGQVAKITANTFFPGCQPR